MSSDQTADGQQLPITDAGMDEDDNEYATPQHLWRPLSRAVDGFDLDAASGAEPTPIAPTRYTKEDNGLEQPWFGDVWLNMPWSSNGDGSAKKKWLRKVRCEATREAVDRIILVLPADTDSHVFHKHILEADAVCLCGPGRIAFIGEDRNPTFALLIAVFGPVTDKLADTLDEFGAVIRGRAVYDPAPQTRLEVVDNGE